MFYRVHVFKAGVSFIIVNCFCRNSKYENHRMMFNDIVTGMSLDGMLDKRYEMKFFGDSFACFWVPGTCMLKFLMVWSSELSFLGAPVHGYHLSRENGLNVSFEVPAYWSMEEGGALSDPEKKVRQVLT